MKTTKIIRKILLGVSVGCLISIQASFAQAKTSTLEVKKRAESQIKNIVEPILAQYCKEQCKFINAQVEIDLAVEENVAPGFEDVPSTATLAPAAAKVSLLIDKNMGKATQTNILNLVKESLKTLDYSVDVNYTTTAFPQPATTSYKVAELRERVTRDIKDQLTSLMNQFCPKHCMLGSFEVRSDVVNPEDVDYGSSQDYFVDGSAAIKVNNVNAVFMVDESLSTAEANSLVQMAKLKLSNIKWLDIGAQSVKFPNPDTATNKVAGNSGNPSAGEGGESERNPASETLGVKSKTEETKDQKFSSLTQDEQTLKQLQELNKTETNQLNTDHKKTTQENNQSSTSENNSKEEKYSRIEKIERVENGDAVQQVLDKFKMYGIVLSSVILALLLTLVAISFRSLFWEGKGAKGGDSASSSKSHDHGNRGSSLGSEASSLTNDEKASIFAKRVEANQLHTELTQVFSEQPKVAKHVFGQVLTEEGVETTGQYIAIFGESVMFDLLKDPGLQADLSELMDFYARNTFDINDEERLQLLRKLHHRTVSSKMALHSSRSAALFDFLAEMDAPQIFEMIKNESNTVKAIVLTQCDTKKRQVIFANHDDAIRLKLMTELSRIDHLPKNYIFNVASALRRKKAENPRLNTEALPGTDVLVSFLERSSMATQRNIIQQLMSQSGDILQNLKTKLVSVETLRFMKDIHLVEVITFIKHDELIQFLQGCTHEVRDAVLMKAPQDLTAELRDELSLAEPVSKEAYLQVERKVLNRIKVMANQGSVNLAEVNERMFASEFGNYHTSDVSSIDVPSNTPSLKGRVA